MIVWASPLSQPGDVLVGDQVPVAGVDPLLDGRVVARRGTGTSCCRSSPPFSITTAGCSSPRSSMAGSSDLGHRRADLDVVEADVRGAAGAAGVEPVVLDDLDAGFLRGVDDRRPGTGVEAREHDDAGTVGDGLLGLGLLRRGVALGVDDREVVALGEAGVFERLLEVPPVVGLPAIATTRCRAGAPRSSRHLRCCRWPPRCRHRRRHRRRRCYSRRPPVRAPRRPRRSTRASVRTFAPLSRQHLPCRFLTSLYAGR